MKFTSNNNRPHGWTWSLILAALLALFSYISALHAQEAAVDDETCLSCHDEYGRSLKGTPHQLTGDLVSAAAEITCSSCHSGGSVHIEDPSPENIGNPGNAFDQDVREVCRTCHDAHLELDNIGFDPHLEQGLSCTSCHKVHTSTDGLLLDRDNTFCAECHTATTAQWNRTSVHPLNDGQIRCLSCHDFTGSSEPAFGHGPAENCYDCHPELSGPFLWEHDATSSFTPDGGGCVACHAPHGSPNERLLNQPGDALCTQCHGVPPLHNTIHNGLGTQYMCIECHSDIHGSDLNRGLLDANLGSKIGGTPASCYCHGSDG